MNIENLNRARNAALAAILAMGLTLPATGLAYAADEDGDDTTTKVKDKLNNLFKDEAEDENIPKKSESVYVFANADGSVKNTVVTNWLKNATEAAKIHDISSLTDIQNTEGKQTFEAKGESLVWDAEGSDIYYQGNTEKSAPVELKITYWLDGVETPASEMAGKSGHVKIRFDYKNNSYSTEYVDGAARTVYTPFVCVTGMMLDNDVFKNVKVENAKSMNDGDRTLVGGYALPGLQEDLDIDKDTVDLPTYFEIEADVENFEMGTTATIVSSNLLDNMNTDELNTDELGDSLNELSDAMGKLIDGTSELYDGMEKLDDGGEKLADGAGELNEKAPDLRDGVVALAKGMAQLASGAATLADGTSQLKEGSGALADGAIQLSDGASTLASSTPALADGASDLADGATQVAEGAGKLPAALTKLSNGIGTAEDGADSGTLLGGANGVSAGLTQLKGGTEENPGLAGAQAGAKAISSGAQKAIDAIDSLNANLNEEASLLEGAKSNVDSAYGILSEIDLDSLDADTAKAIKQAKGLTDGASQQIAGAKKYNSGISDALPNMQSQLSDAKGAADSIDAGLDGALDGVDQLLSGTAAVKDGLLTLKKSVGEQDDTSSETLFGGANQIAAGTSRLADGAGSLSTGATAVNEGAKSLSTGASGVASGASQVNEGVKQLDAGASSLSDGADKLNNGTSDLKAAVPALMKGIKALAEGAETLSDGIGAAKEGTGKLKDGIQQLNDEGIQKIIDAYNENLAGLSDRLKATVDAGKAYDTFTGKSDDMKGSVKFIYETDAIEVDDGE